MAIELLKDRLEKNSYPGRGIAVGLSEDGKHAVAAYFIMGRSVNSRNRIFIEDGAGIKTKAFDEAKLSDPSLIIYSPVKVSGDVTIVTNGDQTDTVFDFVEMGKSFEEALRTREFEPDAPNFTPRISAALNICKGKYSFKMSILKSDDHNPDLCIRNFYEYEGCEKGVARFIHTYMEDGNPLPSFRGEPVKVAVKGDIDSLTEEIWSSLNEENKVSLFVRYIELETGKTETRIVNKNE